MVAGNMLLHHTKLPTGFIVCYFFFISFSVCDSFSFLVIAGHMRRGRQEDSHEFLRYAIDAIQKSCLVGHLPLVLPVVGRNRVPC